MSKDSTRRQVRSRVLKWRVSDDLVQCVHQLAGNDSDRDLMLIGMVYPGWVEFLGVHSNDTATPDGPSMPSLSRASVSRSTELPFSEVDKATGTFEALIRDRSMSLLASPITLREPTMCPTGRFSGTKKLSVEPPPLRKHLQERCGQGWKIISVSTFWSILC